MPESPQQMKHRRKTCGIRLTALARVMRVSIPYLWDLENGNRVMSDRLTLKYNRALGRLAKRAKKAA